jgi:hypothetical protein
LGGRPHVNTAKRDMTKKDWDRLQRLYTPGKGMSARAPDLGVLFLECACVGSYSCSL